MAAFARVSRDIAYAKALHSNSESVPVDAKEQIVNVKKAPGRKQQKKKWKPLDLHYPTADATTTPAWSESDFFCATPEASELSPTSVPQSHQQQSSALADLNELLPSSDTHSKPKPPPKKNRRRRKPKNMAGATPTRREYIPPHLRKKPSDPMKAQANSSARQGSPPAVQDTKEATQLPLTPPSSSSTRPTIKSIGTPTSEPIVEVPGVELVAQYAVDGIAEIAAEPVVKASVKPSAEYANRVVEKTSDPWNDAWKNSLRMGHPRKAAQKKPDPYEDSWNQTLQSGEASKSVPHQKTKWIKNKDLRALPTEEQSDGGVGFDSNSDGDPEYDIRKLTDFNGDWLPAPVEWDSRKAYHDRHFMDHMMNWMNRQIQTEPYMNCVPQLPQGKDTSVDRMKQVFDRSPYLAERNGDIVPHTWIPTKIDGLSAQQFWNTIPFRAPAPLSDVDLNETRPWWELIIPGSTLLAPVEIPHAALDHEDENNNLPRVRDGSSENAIKNRLRAQEKAKMKAVRRQHRSVAVQRPLEPQIPEHTLHPKLNVYLRPVNASDTEQMTAIYNHYIENSITANEFTPRAVAQIAARVQTVVNAGLPWIVAVHRGGAQNSKQLFVSEKIVGFANIDDYCDRGSMYRYCFEMEIYVHPEHLHMGIGSCLVDRMMFLCDPGYNTLGGYDWQVRSEYLRNGPGRVIKTINLSFPHDAADTDEPTAAGIMLKFLRQFNFRRAGHLRRVGYKLGKTVDISVFQHDTDETVNADVGPFDPL